MFLAELQINQAMLASTAQHIHIKRMNMGGSTTEKQSKVWMIPWTVNYG